MNSSECRREAHERLREKQERAVRDHEAKVSRLYEEIPRLLEIKNALAENMRLFSLFAFSGDKNEKKFAEYKERSLSLQRERAKLLAEHGYDENVFDEPYYCHLCKDEGYINNRLCECYKRELSKVYLENSNLAAVYSEQTFDQFELSYFAEPDGSKGQDYAVMKKILGYLKNYAENFGSSSHNLLFVGAPGCGKSFLSCAAACEIIQNGYYVYYSPAQDMISAFEADKFRNGDGSEVVVYKDCDLLIIDDLGTEFKTQFTDSVLYNVINDRINMRKPMIISTNCSLDELKETYHERLCSRLINEFLNIRFADVDVRELKKLKKGRKKQTGDAK